MAACGHDLNILSMISVASCVSILGHCYRPGCVVPLKFDLDNEHIFGQAMYIVPFSDRDEVFVLLRVLIVKYFDDHLHTYVIKETNEFQVINLKDAIDALPLDVYQLRDSEFHLLTRYRLIS